MFHPSLERLAALAEVDAADGRRMAAASDEFSHILQNLRLRGVWKWTGRHRLEKMDQLLSVYVAARGIQQLCMLDIGASDGITTLDTVEYLSRHNRIPATILLLDRDVRLFSIPRHGTTLYFTSSRRPVLLRSGRLALCLEPMEGIEGLLFNRVAARLARRCARELERTDMKSARSISMVNPAAAHCPSIEVCEGDLFSPRPEWFGRFDAIRASNVLNFSYYSEARIRAAVGLMHRYLKEGGGFLASRNLIDDHGETETGALWQKKGSGFVRISGLETPPDISGLVDGYHPGSA